MWRKDFNLWVIIHKILKMVKCSLSLNIVVCLSKRKLRGIESIIKTTYSTVGVQNERTAVSRIDFDSENKWNKINK